MKYTFPWAVGIRQVSEAGTLSGTCFGRGLMESSPGISTGYKGMENCCYHTSASTDAVCFTAISGAGKVKDCLRSSACILGECFQLCSSASGHAFCICQLWLNSLFSFSLIWISPQCISSPLHPSLLVDCPVSSTIFLPLSILYSPNCMGTMFLLLLLFLLFCLFCFL